MAQLSKAPIGLIALLRERLSSEDMRLIAEDYGERCGSEKSLYDQLEAKAGGVDLIPRLLVLHAIHRKNLMLLVRVISERRPDLRKALRSFGFEQSALVKDYLVALLQELGDTEDGGAASSDTRYVIKKTDAFLVAREDPSPIITRSSSLFSDLASDGRLLEVDLAAFLSSHTRITLLSISNTGTSAVLRRLVRQLSVSYQASDPSIPIPVFADLRQWFNAQMSLLEFLQFQITWLGVPQFAETLPDLIRTGRIVLLLDGLDELPYRIMNEKTGLPDDRRFIAITGLGKDDDEYKAWRSIRCVLACQGADFVICPNWRELYVLDAAHKLRGQDAELVDMSDISGPAQLLETQIKNIFARESAAGRMTATEAAELQTRLGYLAINTTYSGPSDTRRRNDLGSSQSSASAWLFHLPEQRVNERGYLSEIEIEAGQEEQQQATRLLSMAADAGLLAVQLAGEDDFFDSKEGLVRFSHQHIQNYFCVSYCRSQSLNDPQLLDRVSNGYFRAMWWLWSRLDDRLADTLLTLLNSSDNSELRRHAALALSWLGDRRAVEPLLAAINSTDQSVRLSTVIALGSLGDSQGVEPLIASLKDEDPQMRLRAALVLGKIEDRRAIEPLIAALTDEDAHVRSAAAYALTKFDDQRVIEPYITALADYSSRAPSRVKEALVRFGDTAVLPLMAALMDKERGEYYYALKDEREGFSRVGSADIPYAAAEILGEIGDIRPLPLLMWLVEHDEEVGETHNGARVRHAAAKAVEQIQKRHQATAPLVAALHSEDSAVRVAAAFALGQLADHRATEPLLSFIQHEDERIRWGAVELLGNIGDDGTIIPLIAALKDQDTKVLLNAADTLYKIGEPAVLPLIVALKDENLQVRFQAARILGKLRNKQAVEPLIAALTDQDGWIRSEAVSSLGMLRDKRALEPLIAAAKDPDKEVRQRVPDAIYAIDPDLTVEVLITALKDKHKDVRFAAAQNLSKMGDSRAVEPLIAALKDEYSLVREYAAYALGKHGDSRAVEALIESLNDSSIASFAAAAALGEIGDNRAIAPLIAMLEGSSSYAARALAKFGERVTPALLAALEDEGPNARFYSAQSIYDKLISGRGLSYEDASLEAKSYLHYHAVEVLDKVGDTRALPTLMWMAANDYNEPDIGKKVREVAAQAMKNVQQRYQSRASLVVALDDEDPFTRVGAAFALCMLDDARATEPLCSALADADRRVRWGAAGLLGNLGGEQAIATLINALEDEDADVRRSAFAALVKIGEAAMQPLITALKEENSNTRDLDWFVQVAYTLSELGEAALQPLIAAMKDQDDSVRYWAANALGKMGDSRAVVPLVAVLEDEDPFVRLSATAALMKLGDDQAFERLIAALGEADENVRVVAILNLQETGSDRAIEPLIAVLNDENRVIRYYAVLALGEVGDSRALPALERLAYNEPLPSPMGSILPPRSTTPVYRPRSVVGEPSDQGSPEVDWPQDSAPPVEDDFLLQDFGVQLPGPMQPDPSQDRIPSAEGTSDDFSPPLDVPVIDMPEQPVEVANNEPREEQIDEWLRDAAREAIRRIKSRQQ